MSNMTPLADVFEFIRNGKSVKQDKSTGGLPITRIETIADGIVDSSRVGYAGLQETGNEKWLLQQGDILFSHINSVEHVGKCALFEGKPEKIIHGMNLLALRPKKQVLNSRYAHRALSSPNFRASLQQFVNKAVNQASISTTNLKLLEIPLPSLDEQRRIAAILDRADALRRKRKRALDLLDSLTQSIFLEMFGDPVSNSRGFRISAFEHLFKTPPNFGSMIPPMAQMGEWVSLRVANIQDWALTLDDSKYIDLPSGSIERHTLLDGDIILARAIASEEHLGKCVVVKPAGRKWAFDSHLMRIRLNTEIIEPVYVRELFRTPGGRQIFLRSTRKTTVQYNINTKELKAMNIPVPPIDLQREFLSRVESLGSIRDFGRRSTLYLEHLFSSLQARAFSGQL